MRELLGPLVDGWSASVHVVDPQAGLRLQVLPLIDGVIARWDLLLAAHRRRTVLAAAASALTAMGEDRRPDARLADWLAAGADEPPLPGGGDAFVPALGEPVNEAEWLGMERRAQMLARLLPIARELKPGGLGGDGPQLRGPPHR